MARAVLHSIPELIFVLGGPSAVGKLVGRKASAVCQWTYERGSPPRAAIPPEHYPRLARAAAAAGYEAPRDLFRCLHCNRLPDAA